MGRAACTKDSKEATGGRTVSLPVQTDGHRPRVARSKMTRWRFLVLVLVHVVFVVHLVQWWMSGMGDDVRETLSPIEPSESMFTLESGLINAGFVLFALAILSTLLFGRFFCGWGCHIIALQDFFGAFLKKIGIHPKPFRTRLLLFMPLAMGLYMFVWPTLKREAVWPLLHAIGGAKLVTDAVRYLGYPVPRPEFIPHFIVEDFWATFAPWYIGIPFLAICGFAVVYFLGNKGFCTYGCPYGGLFGPADLVSVGKIVVNERCEGCGHCTAVCTSNVRVHEEVRDFGQVVDPGCMKCMDCVSVCPNEALSFKFGRPSVFTKPRTGAAKERRRADRSGLYDATLGEEAVLAVVFVVFTFFGFRGLWAQVPLLMSAGLGSIATLGVWKLWRVATTPNVRLSTRQLRLRGRLTPTGMVFVPCAIGLAMLGFWGAWVRWERYLAGYLEWDIKPTEVQVFSASYKPDPEQVALADRSLKHYLRSASFARGGYGWTLDVATEQRVAWLHAVAGRPQEAEAAIDRAIELRLDGVRDASSLGPRREQRQLLASLIYDAVKLRVMQGHTPTQIEEFVRSWAEREPGMGTLWMDLAQSAMQRQDAAAAIIAIDKGLETDTGPNGGAGLTATRASPLLLALGKGDEALAAAKAAVEAQPKVAALRANYGMVLANLGKLDEGLAETLEAARLDGRNPYFAFQASQILQAQGKIGEAQSWADKAEALQRAQQSRQERINRYFIQATR